MNSLDKRRLKKSWHLMKKANWTALSGTPINKCYLVPVGSQVNLVKFPSGRVSYTGVYRCKSSWGCPMCTPVQLAERADVARHMALRLNYKSIMVTYTIQHKKTEPLNVLLNLLAKSIRSARNGRRLAQYNETCLGYLRSTEITYSINNGWHPHYHEVNYLNPGQSEDDLERNVLKNYRDAIEASGKLVNKFTVHKTKWDGDTDYITKAGELTREMVGGAYKEYDESHTIFEILDKANGRDNPNQWSLLYQEFIAATYRRKFLNISKSLDRERKQAEEFIKKGGEYDDNQAEILHSMTNQEYNKICRGGIRYDVVASVL